MGMPTTCEPGSGKHHAKHGCGSLKLIGQWYAPERQRRIVRERLVLGRILDAERLRKPGRPDQIFMQILRRRSGRAGAHHLPVLGMDAHGSFLGWGEAPLCKSSMDTLSGDRMKARRPSRGGRLMVTPDFIRRSQVA